jgi:hypothetical protein
VQRPPAIRADTPPSNSLLQFSKRSAHPANARLMEVPCTQEESLAVHGSRPRLPSPHSTNLGRNRERALPPLISWNPSAVLQRLHITSHPRCSTLAPRFLLSLRLLPCRLSALPLPSLLCSWECRRRPKPGPRSWPRPSCPHQNPSRFSSTPEAASSLDVSLVKIVSPSDLLLPLHT